MAHKIRKATGGAFESRGSFYARVTTAPGTRPAVLLPWSNDLDSAKARASALQVLVNDLRKAGQTEWIPKVIEMGGKADRDKLAALQRTVAGLVEGKIERAEPNTKDGPVTFESFARKWTNGSLHASFPDDIKLKKSKKADALRLAKLYETIGSVPLSTFTLQDAQEAMRQLPEGLEVNTRRHYRQIVNRVLAMAAYPACIIPRSPLPKGFVGKPGKAKAKPLPWPKEDARGLACVTWALEYRMLFGFLPREGMRTSEACSLTWGDLTLDVGQVELDVNKTDSPRAWMLDHSVATALRVWKEMRSDVTDADLVFKRPDGTAYVIDKIAPVYRAYLEDACKARPKMFERSETRSRVMAHSMRSMFVTYALAADRSESWVSARTGHTTSAMIARYRKRAANVTELGLGPLVPMATAIPEIAAAFTAADAAADHEPSPDKSVSNSSEVHGRGLEPLRLAAVEPKSTASAIPPPVRGEPAGANCGEPCQLSRQAVQSGVVLGADERRPR